MDGHIKHLVYCLENAILNLPIGQEQMIWLVDFRGWGMKYTIPIKTAREATNILQNHYPERLHVAILFSPPRAFETFWMVRLWLRSLFYLQDLQFQLCLLLHACFKAKWVIYFFLVLLLVSFSAIWSSIIGHPHVQCLKAFKYKTWSSLKSDFSFYFSLLCTQAISTCVWEIVTIS
jgi:hypothetical protein